MQYNAGDIVNCFKPGSSVSRFIAGPFTLMVMVSTSRLGISMYGLSALCGEEPFFGC